MSHNAIHLATWFGEVGEVEKMTSKKMKPASTSDNKFRELLAGHYDHITAVAARLVAVSSGRGMSVADLTHDAILRMWDSRGGVGLIRSFPAWSAAVVRTTWLLRCRRLDMEKKLAENVKNLLKDRGFKYHTI